MEKEKSQRSIDQKKDERTENLYRSSEKVTNLNKQLILSGFACSWILLNCTDIAPNKNLLFIAIILFSCSILFEVLHYLVEIIVLSLYSTKLLIKQTDNGNVVRNIPLWTVILSWVCWSLKIISTLAGYVLIGVCFMTIF